MLLQGGPFILSRWRVKEGEYILKGQVIADIETDKACGELEADCSGHVRRLLVAEGAAIYPGEPLIDLDESA
ncbi:lipoyl domain-containing protein [Humisphaera borealis]|uniref:Lipoyl-binding domain-containing protein n=1 Tax=Humisphaera borealis TaxID=2807512 RepID=A0A7M2WW95_9BACT|nr:lipoyl domain-containing protein [Humisphaera borealis]QOV88770.1 hypothetical protein IPV69_21460 [Humisphaera borealis]